MKEINETTPDINVLFDYVSVTFPEDKDELKHKTHFSNSVEAIFCNAHFKSLAKLLNINYNEFSDCGRITHYERLITYGEFINIKYNGPKNTFEIPTHSLELKGEGCREAEKLGINWHDFFSYIHEHQLTVSTLHVACDLFHDDYFTIDQLLKKAQKKEYVSLSRKFSVTESSDKHTKTGTSLYFGRRDDNQINIYDKKNERYYKGYEVNTNVWMRFELRLKTSKSWDFIRLYVCEGPERLPILYFNVLKSFLDFKVRSNDSNMNRRNTWRPWILFLNNAEKVKLVNQSKLESTIIKKKSG